MIVATVVGVIALMLGMFPLMMSPMIFDSGESAAAWSIFIFIWLMPAILLGGLIIGWVGLAAGRRAVTVAGLVMVAAPIAIAAGILAMAGV